MDFVHLIEFLEKYRFELRVYEITRFLAWNVDIHDTNPA